MKKNKYFLTTNEFQEQNLSIFTVPFCLVYNQEWLYYLVQKYMSYKEDGFHGKSKRYLIKFQNTLHLAISNILDKFGWGKIFVWNKKSCLMEAIDNSVCVPPSQKYVSLTCGLLMLSLLPKDHPRWSHTTVHLGIHTPAHLGISYNGS